MPSFADIPSYLERLFTGEGASLPGLPERADRVVVVLLDAFGRVFLERFADHPLVRRLAVCDLDSQFPSTTAAHVTTMHTGLPVAAHGLYEWNVYEPSLDRVITPLPFSFAGDRAPDTLRGVIDPRDLVPSEPCLYERLADHGVVSFVHQPDAFSPSTFDGAVIRSAEVRPYREFADALTDALRSVRACERGYAYVYLHAIDLVGHLSGPSSADFAASIRSALDAVEAALVRAAGDDVLVLMTADHGQIDVDPTDGHLARRPPPAAARHAPAPGGQRARRLPARRRRGRHHRRAVAPRRGPPHRRPCSRTPVRGCGSASPRSASSPRRAASPGSAAPPTTASASAATTAAAPPRRPGPTSPRWIASRCSRCARPRGG